MRGKRFNALQNDGIEEIGVKKKKKKEPKYM